MTSLLLIISFLLHVIMLIAIFQLYQQLQKIKQTNDHALETTMQRFISEIKAENNYLRQNMAQKNPPTPTNAPQAVASKQGTDDGLEKEQHPNQANEEVHHQDTYNKAAELVEDKQEQIELSLEGKILQLYQAGYPVDQIARQLTCGKTEVALILELQQRIKRNT